MDRFPPGWVSVFDVIFPRGTRLPGPGEPPLSVARRYQPIHNVGHFRYLDLQRVSVARSDVAAGQEIEERYECSAAGTVAVTIRNATARYQRGYAIGRWAPTAAPLVPPAKRRRRR